MADQTATAPWRIIFCLAIAFVGGLAMDIAGGPLPYMLGGLAATGAVAMIGWPVARPGRPLVLPMRVVIGVMLGATITPELVSKLSALGGSLVFVPIYVLLVAVLGTAYYRFVARFPLNEAYFSALPGGLYTMVTVAEDAGADVRRVSLAHALRVTLVVFAIPLIIRLLFDVETGTTAKASIGIVEVPYRELGLLIAAGIVGGLVAIRVRFPGALIICPMIASAAIHVTGISKASPPYEAIVAAQLVLGAYIGARFVGETFAAVRVGFIYALGHVTLMMGISVALAIFIERFVGLPVITGVLAFAPGGLAEMSLVALGLGLDVGFVATLHVGRILVIVIAAPFAYEQLKSWFEPNKKNE